MYIDELLIRNFRSCAETRVKLHERLTVLVGENNAGKTNVLEALRLLFAPVDGRRSRWAEDADIRRDSGNEFELRATLAGVGPSERGRMVTALIDPLVGTAAFSAKYARAEHGQRRGRFTRWAGAHEEGGEPEPEARDRVRCVHLPALRDAQRDLASTAPGRIAFVLRHLATEDGSEEALLDLIKESRSSVVAHTTVGKAGTLVNQSLADLTEGVRRQTTTLDFADASLLALARELRFKMHEQGLPPEDLMESGMGYANLLYLSVVLVELEAVHETDLTVLLVEEPEAHLHPQLQTLVLKFLEEKTAVTPEMKHGRIQVVVTTHSPQLSAAVSCRNVVVLRSSFGSAKQPEPAKPEETGADKKAQVIERPATMAISVCELPLQDEDVRKIDRYLDIRRAALLFGPRVILVEGIAEALLLPRFANNVFREDEQRLAKFHGTTLIAIDSVDFAPYLRLLLSRTGDGHRIADRVAVLTDEDEARGGLERADAIAELFSEFKAGDAAQLFRTPDTLETALYSASPDLVAGVYMSLHPRSGERLAEARAKTPLSEAARAFTELFTAQRTSKGDFAQRLVEAIDAGGGLPVPEQIRSLLEWTVE